MKNLDIRNELQKENLFGNEISGLRKTFGMESTLKQRSR